MTASPNSRRFSQQEVLSTHNHTVYFSENDASLVTTVNRFLREGLDGGDACLVVATQFHRARLEQSLMADGFNLAAAQIEGTFMALDAREMLDQFLIDGELDPDRFAAVLGSLIERAARGKRSVRIFGEMVALLWAENNQAAAIYLEELWNELGQQYDFSLLCAYPLQDADGHIREREFAQVCQQHSQIIPSGSYARLSEEERLQAFTLLQRKAHALEVEIERRRVAQERSQMLAAIVESTDDAVLSKDLDGIVTSWNSAAERIYGYTAQEMIGQRVTRIFPPHREEEYEHIMARIRRGERVEHYETRRRHKDGRFLTVSVTISPIKNEEGRIVGASTIARDVTEQRLLEAKSQRLFASNLVGIFVADAEGNLREANQAFLDLLGYPQAAKQMDSTNLDQPIATLVPFLRHLVLQAHQSGGTVEPQEMTIQRQSGQTVPVMVAVTSLEHTNTCIGFVLDISERKALEERKDAFIGMASHELKTPLTSLKGFLGVIPRLLAVHETEKALQCLTRMDAQIDKLTKLINDLLDLSRMQMGQLVYREERVEIDDLVREVVENVQEATRTHQIQVEGQARAAVFGDRDRLGQVLINLLNNAIKYSPRASTVIVHLASDETQAQVSVQDFGLGIAPAHHQKIFERFYQVPDLEEKTYPGLGIGLSLSHDIVTRHGGRLWVESQKGDGATFHLCLPRTSQQEHPPAEEQVIAGTDD